MQQAEWYCAVGRLDSSLILFIERAFLMADLEKSSGEFSRRGFMKAASAVALAAAIGTNYAWAQGSDEIRVALIGCGGRGTGAATDCCGSSPNVKLVAMADLFQDRLDGSKHQLQSMGTDKFAVTDDRCFVGWDAYQKVMALKDVNLVILATPPAFRAMMIEAAVEAGKHIFAEKPVAVDPAGVHSVLASYDKINDKKLCFVCGTQRRHDAGYNDVIKRIHDGAIGEILSGNIYWNQGGLWLHPRQPDWSDMETQVRNWIYYTWIGGDHIVEQHVHQIDVMNWVMQDNPTEAYAMGGRQSRTDPAYGDVFDHFATEFTFKNGARIASQCRQQDGTDARVAEYFVGAKGTSDPAGWIKGENKFRYKRPEDILGPYQQEHADLIHAIRTGNQINEAKRIAEVCMAAIMARMSAYTGKKVTWDEAMGSKVSMLPAKLELGPLPVAPVAIPGRQPTT
jgi:predicted dehydrogenase